VIHLTSISPAKSKYQEPPAFALQKFATPSLYHSANRLKLLKTKAQSFAYTLSTLSSTKPTKINLDKLDLKFKTKASSSSTLGNFDISDLLWNLREIPRLVVLAAELELSVLR